MANVMRWRYGETNPVMVSVNTSTVIEIGDLVWLGQDHVVPANVKSASELATLGKLHERFLGVAMQDSSVSGQNAIRISTTGVFEFACQKLTYELGDLIGGLLDAKSERLLAQSVGQAVAPGYAIGRCAKAIQPAGSNVLVDIVSTVMRGGVQAIL